MDEVPEARFTVASENKAAAVAYVTQRGFPPVRVQEAEDGLVVLVFQRIAKKRLSDFAQALPLHLSAKVAYVVGHEASVPLPHESASD
jgi:hypothetical protein